MIGMMGGLVGGYAWRMAKKYHVTLTESERADLRALIGAGKAAARTLAHARILLKADRAAGGPAWSDEAIAPAVEVSVPTIERVRQRFVLEGLEAALRPRPARGRKPRKLDGAGEARLIALACSEPPAGHGQWSLRLLADTLVELEYVEAISHETVRQVLKQTS
jgi:transposase